MTPDEHLIALSKHIVYYKAFWYWQTENKEIRKWNLHQSRAAIFCAAVCYKMAKKRSLAQ